MIAIPKPSYRTLAISLTFFFCFTGFLLTRLYGEFSKNHNNGQALREGNEQIYKELEMATDLMIINSDILMRFNHYQNNHDPSKEQAFLCPECTSPWPPEKKSSKWKGFTLTDEELIEIENNAMLYNAEDAIYDTREVATQIQRLSVSLNNQRHKLEHTLLKMRDDSEEQEQKETIPRQRRSTKSLLVAYNQKIHNKDGQQGLEDFHDAIEANIRPELHDKLAPLVAAIRYAENGRAGREYGVLHPDVEPTYRSQAGWCAATVQKNWDRYKEQGGDTEDFKKYIAFLGSRYCPIDDPRDTQELNKYWVNNVYCLHKLFTVKF